MNHQPPTLRRRSAACRAAAVAALLSAPACQDDATSSAPSTPDVAATPFVDTAAPDIAEPGPDTAAPDVPVAPGELAVTAVEPAQGSARGGEPITVVGDGFAEGARVLIGGVEAPLAGAATATALEAVTPTLLAGPYDVTVELGEGAATLAGAYTALPLDLRFSQVADWAFPGAAESDWQAGVVADWDADGDLDLAVVADGLPPELLRNDGNGNFAFPSAPTEPPTGGDTVGGDTVGGDAAGAGDAGDAPAPDAGTPDAGEADAGEPPVPLGPARDAAAADLDGDGCPDLLVTYTDAGCVTYRGDCGGRFLPDELALEAQGALGPLAVGDVDGDGVADVVIGDVSPAPGTGLQLHLFSQVADAHVRADATWLPPHVEANAALLLGDLNGDGAPDLVVGNAEAKDGVLLRVLLQVGGRFVDAPAGMVPPVDGAVRHLAAGDLDGDGDLDLVILRADGQDMLLRNDGGGFLFDDTLLSMPVDVSDGVRASLADLDLDGDLDLLVANDPQQDRLYLNDGAGRFKDLTPLLPLAQDPTRAILPADADGDGDLDLLMLAGPGAASRLLLSVKGGTP